MRMSDPAEAGECLRAFDRLLNGADCMMLREVKNGGRGVVETVLVSFSKWGWAFSWTFIWVLIRYPIQDPIRTKILQKSVFFEV